GAVRPPDGRDDHLLQRGERAEGGDRLGGERGRGRSLVLPGWRNVRVNVTFVFQHVFFKRDRRFRRGGRGFRRGERRFQREAGRGGRQAVACVIDLVQEPEDLNSPPPRGVQVADDHPERLQGGELVLDRPRGPADRLADLPVGRDREPAAPREGLQRDL